MNFIKKLLTKTYYPENTCFQILGDCYSQKERDDLGFIESYKDQMPYIKKMIAQIESNMKNGKISKKEHNAELQHYWAFRKSF